MRQIIEWDRELFLWLNSLGNDFWDPFWLTVSGVFIWIPFYAFLIFLLYRKLPLRNFIIALILVAVNTVLTDQLSVILFKEQFMRLRPCHVEELLQQMRLVPDGCGGSFGFVSSHAANTFGMAVLVGYILKPFYKNAIWLLLIWATVISYSRVYLGVHYPLDILGGGILGSIFALMLNLLYRNLKR